MVISMVIKGITRRVIVVKTPDTRLFDEAVFFLHGDTDCNSPEILAEANAVARNYVRERFAQPGLRRFHTPLIMLAGAGAASIIWALLLFLMWLPK